MKFSPIIALVLGGILAALEGVQLHIGGMSLQVHDGITLAITVLAGLGVLAASPSAIIAAVPHQTLVVITAAVGALNVIQGDWSMSATAHTIIAVVLVVINALFSSSGVAPTVAVGPSPPASAG